MGGSHARAVGTGAVAAGPRLRAGPATAAAIGLVTMVATALAFEPRLRELGAPTFVERFNAFRAAGALGFGLAGAFVVHHQSRNRVGSLLLGIGAAQALSMLASSYGLTGIHEPGAPLPLAEWAQWISEWLWAPGYWLVPTALLLIFPTGRLPSARWWPAAAGAVVAAASSAVGWAVLPPADTDVAGLYRPGYEGPVPTSTAVADTLLVAGLVVGGSTTAVCLVSLIQRYRRSVGSEREQFRWVLLAALVTVFLLAVAFVVPAPTGPALVGLAMLPLPAAMAVAVVQHRLWDIDVVLSRSLVFAWLSVVVLAAYGACVVLLGRLLGARSGAPLLATALVAIGIEPAHRRFRALVNRFVYGDRDDPAEVLRRLGDRLRGAGDPDEVLAEIAQSIAVALRVPFVAVETTDAPAPARGAAVGAVERVALNHGGVELGHLVVAIARGDRLRPGDRAALAQLAPHVAVVVHAQRLAHDLERSHHRLLAARADERARLRRELHDGLGPMLAALALEVDRGRLLSGADPGAAGPLLDGLAPQIRDAVGTVRAIVDDLRPPPLDDLGLVGALDELGARFRGRLDVGIRGSVPRFLPADVELAAYRIAAEAMTNAVRHSGGTWCRVSLATNHATGEFEVVVEDDGRGVTDDQVGGVGLGSMRLRAAELGGRCVISPRPGGGTTVAANLPVHDEAEHALRPR